MLCLKLRQLLGWNLPLLYPTISNFALKRVFSSFYTREFYALCAIILTPEAIATLELNAKNLFLVRIFHSSVMGFCAVFIRSKEFSNICNFFQHSEVIF